jgi:hypothetical protein
LQKVHKTIVFAIAPWWTLGAVFEALWLIFYGRETPLGFAISAIALVYGAFFFIQALFAVNGTVPRMFSLDVRALAAAGSALNGAWLSVAACVGILTVVPYPNAQVELAGVLLALCAGAGVFITIRTSSVVYPAVLVWALVAVIVVEGRQMSVRIFATAGIFVSISAAVVALVRKLLVAQTGNKEGSQYAASNV